MCWELFGKLLDVPMGNWVTKSAISITGNGKEVFLMKEDYRAWNEAINDGIIDRLEEEGSIESMLPSWFDGLPDRLGWAISRMDEEAGQYDGLLVALRSGDIAGAKTIIEEVAESNSAISSIRRADIVTQMSALLLSLLEWCK